MLLLESGEVMGTVFEVEVCHMGGYWYVFQSRARPLPPYGHGVPKQEGR